METDSIEKLQYQQALVRVKKIKGFYTHLVVYVVVNLMIMILNIQDLDKGESYFQWRNFTTLFFWGIGLISHALSTFMPNFIFGKNWEDKKIKEFMEKEKSEKWE
ncbi:2TM domain-containing protein [Flavobacterium yafengii]|uniref:2TM domain-containing protein n=1 Tax=Flavobacterium yafengii TaxID=3041253 RepID=UPI0024A8B23D|nr:2TM domain-containing protein [Flavobacterium yafengii]MDI5897323.1 2TM domain-containing protein [Flavobacterium yafengii]MDI6045961.1 2TM domain-containing protein [Flavobacterium yafengii]